MVHCAAYVPYGHSDKGNGGVEATKQRSNSLFFSAVTSFFIIRPIQSPD